MIAEGQTGAGLGLIYGLVIVGLTDNLIEIHFLKRLENIHPLNTVFGIIMGYESFRFYGFDFLIDFDFNYRSFNSGLSGRIQQRRE
jgi:hypothetical protein